MVKITSIVNGGEALHVTATVTGDAGDKVIVHSFNSLAPEHWEGVFERRYFDPVVPEVAGEKGVEVESVAYVMDAARVAKVRALETAAKAVYLNKVEAEEIR